MIKFRIIIISLLSVLILKTSPAQTTLFDDFPWLSGVVDTTTCTTEQVELYRSGIHDFLLVIGADGIDGATLYNGDGDVHCQNQVNYNCPVLFRFGPPISPATWTCSAASESSGDSNTNQCNITVTSLSLIHI